MKRKTVNESWHTAAIFVEIVKRIETRLLLLVCLERVASLKIRVLHDHDPTGPGQRDKTGKNQNKISEMYIKIPRQHLLNRRPEQQTNSTVGCLMLCCPVVPMIYW